MLKKAVSPAEHYLKAELYGQVRCDPTVFDFLQSATLDGLWYWDLENPQHEWMSESFWQLLGYEPETKEHLATEWQDIIHPDDLERASKNLHQHFLDPNHPYDQIVRYTHRDGSTVWVRCRGMAIRDHTGSATRMLGAHTDVTALMQARHTLEKKAKRLTKEVEKRKAADNASEAKTSFLANMSHELRTPLNAIIGMADLMSSELYGAHSHPKYKEYSNDIIQSGKHLLAVINDILDLARIETRKLILHESTFCIRECIEACVTMVSANTETDRIQIHIEENIPDLIADERLVRQTIMNILTNACKFSQADKPITLDVCLSKKKSLHISVRDQGIGIAQKDIEQIMEPFIQASENIAHANEGVGLGLPLVKKFMELHGGIVKVQSTLGKGTEITLIFPPGRSHIYL